MNLHDRFLFSVVVIVGTVGCAIAYNDGGKRQLLVAASVWVASLLVAIVVTALLRRLMGNEPTHMRGAGLVILAAGILIAGYVLGSLRGLVVSLAPILTLLVYVWRNTSKGGGQRIATGGPGRS